MPSTCPSCNRAAAEGASFCMFCGGRLNDPLATVDHVEADPEALQDTVPDAQPPSHVGGYRILRQLGEGGMGTVFEAESDESGQRVAVKLLSNKLAANPTSVERFKQEGRLASQISHPHCVFVYSADADSGRPFIVMELMPGLTLKDLVEQKGRLSPQDAVARILDVVDGLIEAHRLGLIHRDVKPSNCFLTADDRVKVGDFGLSKSLVESQADGALTGTGAFLGTVLFAPPEQIRGEDVGYDSDVYSVCGTLYYLLAGKAPYQHESMTAALAKAISEPPPSLRRLRPDVPKALDRLVLKGLERDRKRRFGSLEELRDALQQLMPEEQVPARTRMLFAAYLIDLLLTLFLVQLPVELLEWLIGLKTWLFGSEFLFDPISTLGYLLYFALGEGFAGATVGKWLLGLRVVPYGSVGPPGFGLALFRSGVFHAGWLLLGLGVHCMAEVPVWGLPIGLGLIVGGVAFLTYRQRRVNSNRGLHDLASGCHVVQVPRRPHRVRLTSQAPSRIERAVAVAGLPKDLGGFSLRGRLTQFADDSQVWLADDRSLGRRVLLHVLPQATETVMPPSRPTRLRLLGTGELHWQDRDRTWHAFAAPAGAPLADMIRKPLDWPDARLLLEQVVEELEVAQHDGTLPQPLNLNQVWSEPGGRVFLLDFAMPSLIKVKPAAEAMDLVRQVATLLLEGTPRSKGSGVQAPLPPRASAIINRLFDAEDPHANLGDLQCELADSHAYEPAVTHKHRATHLGIAAMLLALPILIMFFCTATIGYHATLVSWSQLMSARSALRGLDQPSTIAALRQHDEHHNGGTGPSTHDRLKSVLQAREDVFARDVSYLSKPERYVLGQSVLTAREPDIEPGQIDAPSAGKILDESGSPEDEARALRQSLIYFAAVICGIGLAAFTTFAIAFRGGLANVLAGIALVRRDGRPANRWLCGLREIALWTPLVIVLLLAAFIQLQWPAWFLGRSVAIGLAMVLLVTYAALGFRHPVQGPLDRLFGTYRVPV